MQIKSIITRLHKREEPNDETGLQFIRAETMEGNKIVFWGSPDSCVNLKALETQDTPILITCEDCEKEKTCKHLLGDFFSVSEKSLVTIYPYDPRRITTLLRTVKSTDQLVKILT